VAEIDDLERDRLRLGSYIVGRAILAAAVSLLIVIIADTGKQTPTSVTDKVALLGAITTFIGLVVGVFFGVNASGSAHARNTASALETSQAAGTVADAAQSVTDTARALSEPASRSMDAAHALLERSAAASGLPTADRYGSADTIAEGDDVESLAGDLGEAPTKLIIPSARGEAVDTFARGAIHIANPVSAQALFTQQVLAVAAVEADAHVSQVWNPPNDWDSSAMDALTVEGFTGKTDWSLARVLYRWEAYNGFGSRARGINTPYLWSFSTHYERGKFLSDRHWDPNLVSKQCGVAVMLRALVDAGQVDPLPDA
jgi:hypothetical protein